MRTPIEKMPCSGRYAVSLLGDMHYDAEPESFYHSHYDESNKWAEIQHSEFRRNGEMWRERSPSLVAACGVVAAQRHSAFVLQLGDLVQGDCDDAPTHSRMLRDCIEALRRPFPPDLPFISVIGNHDFRGKGAFEAYMEFAEPFLAREIGREVHYPVFSFRAGPDAWVLCDFERVEPAAVADEIDGITGARWVFLVTHGPFTLSEERSWRWRLGGRKSVGRERLYETLCRRHAVVLSGHTHRTAFYRHETPSGSFCEFTLNSVWSEPKRGAVETLVEGAVNYGRRVKECAAAADAEDLERELSFFRRGLHEYFLCDVAAHALLDVSDDTVTLALYPGLDREPGRMFRLAGG